MESISLNHSLWSFQNVEGMKEEGQREINRLCGRQRYFHKNHHGTKGATLYADGAPISLKKGRNSSTRKDVRWD